MRIFYDYGGLDLPSGGGEQEAEIWLPVPEYNGYFVSNFGNAKRAAFEEKPERMLAKVNNSDGYLRISMKSRVGKWESKLLHRMIAMAHIPNPENLPQVNHINGIKTDNRAMNLEWCTSAHNIRHAFKVGLKTMVGQKNNASTLTDEDVLEIRRLRRDGVCRKKIAAQFGIHKETVNDIFIRKTWKHL